SVFNSSFSPTQGSGWSSKNALKISMLKSGERLVFSNWQLRLSGLTQTGLPSAQFDALDPFGASLVSFSVPNDHAVELVLPDGSRFIVAAVFAVGEGSKASVQAQVYEAKDLSKSNLSIQVSEPQNGFTVEQMFPAPPKIQSGSLAIGDRMDAGAFRLLLIGLDPSLKPPGAQYGLEDSGGLPIDRFNLGLGQMVVLHMSDDTRYAVVFRGLSTVPDLAAQTDIYKITVFLKNNSSSAS
ncbi:MAG: hypothetical protein V1728_05075, partial [Candidatus Micrarchaeota archaeon]